MTKELCNCGVGKPHPIKYVTRSNNFDHYKLSDGERLEYLERTRDDLQDAIDKGYKLTIKGKYLIIPGYGIELALEFNSVGSITGFLEDTSGG